MLPERYWRFMDYIDHRGQNVVLQDLRRFPAGAKAAINHLILNLEVTRPPFDIRDVKKLRNKNRQNCLGFIELRIRTEGVQYRPIAWYGPDEQQITIFGIAVEQNSRLHPFGICDTCNTRRGRLSRNEGRIVSHDFS